MDKVLDSAILSSANKRKGILAIDAHPDDIELGCGASLARLAPIHLNFADTRAHLQLNDMISALEDIIKNQIPSDVEIMRVYTMHDADRHQDHLAVYQASMVACRTIPQILGYETPSTWLSFMPQVFESVKEEYFTVKLAALKKHKSQERRDYMRHDRLRAVAQFRGQQVNSDLGEGFVIHKMIL
ncbi:MAG: PIG-L deacetylase family protein [Escherichia coli]|nr:PIG-L deacetylase family protein [Escherichia coli]